MAFSAPQSTVLAPFIFTLYTFDAKSSEGRCSLITAMMGLIKNGNDKAYLRQIQSSLIIAIQIFQRLQNCVLIFIVTKSLHLLLLLKGMQLNTVIRIYLSVALNNRLTWGDHVDVLVKMLKY